MRPELESLLERMAVDDEPSARLPQGAQRTSSDSASWKAHREAEALNDATLVDELAAYISTERDKKRRGHAYFVLGKLGLKVRNLECVTLLLEGALRETDKYVLSSLLDLLAQLKKPASVDLTILRELLKDKRWLVRHSAIGSLKNSTSPEVEDWLLHLLASTSDTDDMVYTHSVLNNMGTAKAIPYLEANLKSRKRDVKDSAALAIEAIKERQAQNTVVTGA